MGTMVYLVERTGIEPKATEAASAAAGQPAGLEMERMGIEPMTPCLQSLPHTSPKRLTYPLPCT